jgi:AraC-like DNA-binding protein
VGTDEHHLFVLRIDYSQATDRHPAPVTLYHSDSLANIGYFTAPVLTPDGDIVLTGGIAPDNFTPTGTVYLLRVGSSESGDSVFVSSAKSRLSTLRSYLILGIALTIAVLVALVYFFYVRRLLVHSIKGGGEEQLPEEQPSIDNEASADQTRADQELMERIDQLMVERQFFKQADLKVQDIAAALGVHARRVSAVIRTCRDNTFVQYVNSYRVEYVKRLLQEQPTRKIASLWSEAGFSSETSFFRTFKALAGMTPTEWAQK